MESAAAAPVRVLPCTTPDCANFLKTIQGKQGSWDTHFPGDSRPIESTVIVDPAGVKYVSGKSPLTEAGGLSGNLYTTLGITTLHPTVSGLISAPGQAAPVVKYGNRPVLHAIGPDFGDENEGVDRVMHEAHLNNVYKHIFERYMEWLLTQPYEGEKELRLCLISGGIFRGNLSEDEFLGLSAQAVWNAYQRLPTQTRVHLRGGFNSRIVMVIPQERMSDLFVEALRQMADAHLKVGQMCSPVSGFEFKRPRGYPSCRGGRDAGLKRARDAPTPDEERERRNILSTLSEREQIAQFHLMEERESAKRRREPERAERASGSAGPARRDDDLARGLELSRIEADRAEARAAKKRSLEAEQAAIFAGMSDREIEAQERLLKAARRG